MIAVIPVRGGVLPAGGAETAAECGGHVLLAFDAVDTAELAESVDRLASDGDLESLGSEVRVVALGPFAVGSWAARLAPVVVDHAIVVLPASPDGRDLAPRLAHRLGRALIAGAVQVSADRIVAARDGGSTLHVHRTDGAVIATLQPGVRGTDGASGPPSRPEVLEVAAAARVADAHVVEVLPPDVTTMDLAEAPRIVGGGAGLDGAGKFDQLTRIATSIGASMGATRVITDRHWVGHERQIGTTGVIVDPVLYLSFGISGAVQHTSGLGTPRHVVSVNTDPHCPMMQLSDLAVVADANATIDHLERLLAHGRTVAPAPGDTEAAR